MIIDKKRNLKENDGLLFRIETTHLPPPFSFSQVHALYSFIVSIGFIFFLTACGDNRSAKFNQYYVQGEKLYISHCSNCHQKEGSGLGRVYPPVNVSDYMDTNFKKVICLIKFGTDGNLIVNGKEFNQPMKGVNKLSDLEIAEIATYIYNTWSHERGIVDVREVSKILESCQATD